MEKAGVKNKVVAVIGDSTFYHSGITGLVDVITSGAATTVIILDNCTTAMTGGNVNPGTGQTVNGEPARRVELETLCRGLGIEDVQVIDAYDNDAITQRPGPVAAVDGAVRAHRPGALRAAGAEVTIAGLLGGAGQVRFLLGLPGNGLSGPDPRGRQGGHHPRAVHGLRGMQPGLPLRRHPARRPQIERG